MATLTRQRIRIAGDAARTDGPRDLQSNATPVFWRGNDLQFEIGVFNNGVLMEVSNLASITVEIKGLSSKGTAPDPGAVALMSKTVGAGSLNNALLLADWNSGIDQHAVVAFTGGESNIAASRLWLAVWATTNDSPGRNLTLAAGLIEAAEDGVGLATTPSPPQEVFYTAVQSDARFAQVGQNLADLGDAPTARTNLGLGTASTQNTGTGAGDIPVLNGSGLLDDAIIPAFAITSVITSAESTLANYITNEWSAGAVQEGDAVVLTTGQVYMLTSAGNGSLEAHYKEINPNQIDWANVTNKPTGFTPSAHAASHTDGSDDIQSASTSQKGLMTAADKTKLDGIESGATADQTGAEIKTAYEANADTNAFSDAALRRNRVAYHQIQTGLI